MFVSSGWVKGAEGAAAAQPSFLPSTIHGSYPKLINYCYFIIIFIIIYYYLIILIAYYVSLIPYSFESLIPIISMLFLIPLDLYFLISQCFHLLIIVCLSVLHTPFTHISQSQQLSQFSSFFLIHYLLHSSLGFLFLVNFLTIFMEIPGFVSFSTC